MKFIRKEDRAGWNLLAFIGWTMAILTFGLWLGIMVGQGVQSNPWRTMDSAPRDGTVVEIKDNFGTSRIAKYRWTNQSWSSDEWCTEGLSHKDIHGFVFTQAGCSNVPISGSVYHPPILQSSSEYGWESPTPNAEGGSGLISTPTFEQYYRWRQIK